MPFRLGAHAFLNNLIVVGCTWVVQKRNLRVNKPPCQDLGGVTSLPHNTRDSREQDELRSRGQDEFTKRVIQQATEGQRPVESQSLLLG